MSESVATSGSQYQIIVKVVESADISLLVDYGLTTQHFSAYSEEYAFILDHYSQYGNVPDKLTFLSAFPEFEFAVVAESDDYLINSICEEFMYYSLIPFLRQVEEYVVVDANKAVEYVQQNIVNFSPNSTVGKINLLKDTNERYELFEKRRTQADGGFFTTGFRGLDDQLYGWSQEGELIVFFARTGKGKSWVILKTLHETWQSGHNVAIISPEMTSTGIGYRFDTLNAHLSNSSLVKATTDRVTNAQYKNYLDELTGADFLVSTPQDFQRNITVSRIRSYIKSNNIELLGIDGITYLTDERAKKGDNKTTMLTNISEDLMDLSLELKVPILIAVQSNRQGVSKKHGDDDQGSAPDIENIRDSDGIAYNATKIIALNQTDEGLLEMIVRKHRDGEDGGIFTYSWNIDTGIFEDDKIVSRVASSETAPSRRRPEDKF